MHIPDGFLDPGVAAAAGVVAAGAVGIGLRRAEATFDERRAPLLGVTAAFIFAAQMLSFPVAGGTSGHVLGAALAVVLLGLFDMYHSLMHPSGKGPLSARVLAAVWRLSRATGHRLGSAVGPAGMIAVVVLWVLLQGVGWALVYLPHVPGGFVYSSGVDPAEYPDAAEALYVSLVTLATLGFGDVVATDPWIRLASPLEALTGFALLPG